jgi:hypothetical protein
MLHHDPLAAAKFVNGLGGSVEAWWESQDVRSVAEEARKLFALSSKDWLEEWSAYLSTHPRKG